MSDAIQTPGPGCIAGGSKASHGFTVAQVGLDGVERKTTVLKFGDGYLLVLESKWSETDIRHTQIGLSEDGFVETVMAMNHAVLHIDKYPILESAEDSAGVVAG